MYNKYLKYKIKFHKLNNEFINKYLTELKNMYSNCKHDSGNNYKLYEGNTITYGEMTYEGIDKLNAYVNKNNDFRYFMDIGSGRGKLSLYMRGMPRIIKSYGIELVKERYDDSIKLKNDLAKKFDYYTNDVEFINNDLFKISIKDLIDSKVFIWMSNLCFDTSINDNIFKKLYDELPKDSIICCSKKPSVDIEKLFRINTDLKEIAIPMSWSDSSNVYIYIK